MCYSYLLTFILIAWLDFIILCIILCLICSIYVPVRRWSHLQEKVTVVPSERLSFINSHTMCMSCIFAVARSPLQQLKQPNKFLYLLPLLPSGGPGLRNRGGKRVRDPGQQRRHEMQDPELRVRFRVYWRLGVWGQCRAVCSDGVSWLW